MIDEGSNDAVINAVSRQPGWAAGTTVGSANGAAKEVRSVIILADGDDPGDAAANLAAYRGEKTVVGFRIILAPGP